MEDRRASNRRLGPRVPVGPLDVAWRVAPPDASPKERRRHRAERATLLDLSVSGALVEARTANELSVGAVLYLAIDDQVGKVRIRRMVASGAKGQSLYGVEFAEFASDLYRYVRDALSSMSGSPAVGRRGDDALG